MVRKGGGFKNLKLGKNVFRQIKRRGAPDRLPVNKQPPKNIIKKLEYERDGTEQDE
jgi:hypothetical protein